jgi:uncharacterized phiE125 gp8 family phage protein
MYGLRVVTGPTTEPVSLAEVRAQARIDATTDDPTLAGYIVAARQYVEQATGRALLPQTFELTLDGFLPWAIELPRAPVSSIVSVSYLDAAGATQTVSASDYILDATRLAPQLTPAFNKVWPATRGTAGNVKIQFIAGEAQPPAPLRAAILLLVAQWNENREAPPENPAVDALLAPYRINYL